MIFKNICVLVLGERSLSIGRVESLAIDNKTISDHMVVGETHRGMINGQLLIII